MVAILLAATLVLWGRYPIGCLSPSPTQAIRFGLYATLEGTSLAAAHVSGALALLLSAAPTLTADEQETILTQTAVDLGDPGPDNQFGYGRINVAAAIDRVRATHPAPAGGWLALELVGVIALMLLGVVGVMRWRRVDTATAT